jgi:hypothetical protein
MKTRALLVPPLWCPILPAIHPNWRTFDASTIAWMERFAIATVEVQRDRLAKSKFGEIGARWMPRGPAIGVQLLADYLLWICAPDDDADEGALARDPARLASVYAQVLQAIEGPCPILPSDAGNYARAMHDIRLRFGEIVAPGMIAPWTDAVKASFLSTVQETANRASGLIPSLDDYVATRIESIWVRPVAKFTAGIDCADLRAEELEFPAVRALTEMTCLIVAFDNDIFSYAKEHVRGGDCQTLLAALSHAHHCSIAEALTEAVGMRDRILARFLFLRDHVAQNVHTGLRRYLANLSSMIRGNLDWSFTSERYIAPTEELVWPILIAEEPTDLSSSPPLPVIRHWWETTLEYESGLK